jgi:hypothetical protein
MMDSWLNAARKASNWKEISSASSDYAQTGTGMPTFSTGGASGFMAGSDVPPQGYGYGYASPEYLASGLSFDINKRQGALGTRSGEQLLRLQQGSGNMNNEQLQRELELRNIRPSGISLPPV